MTRADSEAVGESPFATWPRPLAFVLSGGGAFGPVQVGMLRALEERSVRPDLIVGTSVGALNGALLAASDLSGSGYRATIARLAELWSTTDRRTVFGRRRRIALNVARRRSLADPAVLSGLIERHVGRSDFDDLGIPFAAVATDALTGEPELLTSGPLRPALMASAAVPGVFPAVEVDGRSYIDGGVAANVPLRQAIAFGARSIVSLDTTPPVVASRLPTTLSGGLIHAVALMLRNQRSDAVDELATRYPIATLPSTTPPDMGTFNFSRTPELIERSQRRTREALDAFAATNTLDEAADEGRADSPSR